MKTKEILILILIIAIIFFGFGYFAAREKYKDNFQILPNKLKVEYKIDTLLRPNDTIKIKGKGKITYSNHIDTLWAKDTLYESRPFISCLDTIIGKDTVHSAYFFPLDYHYITIKPHQDSIITKTITIYQPVEIKEPWYKQPLIIAGSLAGGYLLGRIK